MQTSQTFELTPRRRRAGVMALVLGLVAVVALVGIWLLAINASSGSDPGASLQADLYQVESGGFDVTIPASGELAALKQIEIRNPLESRDAIITFIVDEGETVRAGEVLVRFADEEIKDVITEHELDVLSGQNSLIAAQNSFAIQESENASQLSQARTNLELADIAYEQWEKGDTVSKRQDLALALATAERNVERLAEKFEESKKLVVDGIISRDEYKQDEIAKIEAEASLVTANLDIEVYETYEFRAEQKEKQAAVDRATEELERIQQQNKAELIAKKDDVDTADGRLEIRRQQLAYWKDQLSKCVIIAPSPGLVVYAASLGSSRHGGDDKQPPEIGTSVRRNDRILVLPDISQMIAKVKVHESISGRVDLGQRVQVISDALPGQVLHGTVYSVGVMATGGSWRDPNRRDYTIDVMLEDTEGLGLKPSMRCKSEIYLDRVDDALYVPIAAVFRQGGVPYVYVQGDSGFAQRAIQTGRPSLMNIEIVSGVEAGDHVLLREPKESEINSRLDFEELAAANPSRGREHPTGGRDASRDGSGGPMARGASNPGGGRESGDRGGGMAGGGMAQMFSRLDKNSDGKLQRDELPEQMQSSFDAIDANGDGALEESEMTQMGQPHDTSTGS